MIYKQPLIAIKGAGEMASGIAWRLHRAGFHHLLLLETDNPQAVRRNVCFSEAVYDGEKIIDGVKAVLVEDIGKLTAIFEKKQIGVLIDQIWASIAQTRPAVVIDAILAKKNIGTTLNEAALTIGLGPGFTAGKDVHAVIETKRGPDCGRVLYDGMAAANTGIPEPVLGYDKKRVLKAPVAGTFRATVQLGTQVQAGDTVGTIDNKTIFTQIEGRVRGLIRSPIQVTEFTKLGDIEPRSDVNLNKISDKALSMGGAALEAVLHHLNK